MFLLYRAVAGSPVDDLVGGQLAATTLCNGPLWCKSSGCSTEAHSARLLRSGPEFPKLTTQCIVQCIVLYVPLIGFCPFDFLKYVTWLSFGDKSTGNYEYLSLLDCLLVQQYPLCILLSYVILYHNI